MKHWLFVRILFRRFSSKHLRFLIWIYLVALLFLSFYSKASTQVGFVTQEMQRPLRADYPPTEAENSLYFLIPPRWESVGYMFKLENESNSVVGFRVYVGSVLQPQIEQTLLPQEVKSIDLTDSWFETRLIKIESDRPLYGEFLVHTPDERTPKVPAFSRGLKTATFEFYKGPEAEGMIHLANVNSKPISVEIVTRDPHEVVLEEKEMYLVPNSTMAHFSADFSLI